MPLGTERVTEVRVAGWGVTDEPKKEYTIF